MLYTPQTGKNQIFLLYRSFLAEIGGTLSNQGLNKVYDPKILIFYGFTMLQQVAWVRISSQSNFLSFFEALESITNIDFTNLRLKV